MKEQLRKFAKRMLDKKNEEIIQKIKDHIMLHGGEYIEWYVGISEEPETRLAAHKVRKPNIPFLVLDCKSTKIARAVEDYCHDVLGCDGDKGGGKNPHYVYVYKKSKSTDEST